MSYWILMKQSQTICQQNHTTMPRLKAFTNYLQISTTWHSCYSWEMFSDPWVHCQHGCRKMTLHWASYFLWVRPPNCNSCSWRLKPPKNLMTCSEVLLSTIQLNLWAQRHQVNIMAKSWMHWTNALEADMGISQTYWWLKLHKLAASAFGQKN